MIIQNKINLLTNKMFGITSMEMAPEQAYSYIKVTGCLYVLLYRRILLIAKPIWFSFAIYIIIVPRMFYNYFGGREPPHFREKLPPERNVPSSLIYFFKN